MNGSVPLPSDELYKDIKSRLVKPKIEIEYDENDKNYLGFYTYIPFDLHRKHAVAYIWNRGRTKAVNVRGIFEVENTSIKIPPAYLHWRTAPFKTPDPEPVEISKGAFRVLDIVFSQPKYGSELTKDLVSRMISGSPEKGIYPAPSVATLPPGVVGDLELLNRDRDRLRETYSGMYEARENGCFIATNLALLFPKEFSQFYLPLGEYAVKIKIVGDNISETTAHFNLVSPEYWRDLHLELK